MRFRKSSWRLCLWYIPTFAKPFLCIYMSTCGRGMKCGLSPELKLCKNPCKTSHVLIALSSTRITTWSYCAPRRWTSRCVACCRSPSGLSGSSISRAQRWRTRTWWEQSKSYITRLATFDSLKCWADVTFTECFLIVALIQWEDLKRGPTL